MATNPWLKKNPFMSMWLSGANTVANTARAHAAAAVKRQSQAVVHQATQDVFDFWTGALASPPAAKKKRARKKR